jgi:hypothetical protein
MRFLGCLLVAATLLVAGAAPSITRAATKSRPFLLVALPALGTVTWRCDLERQSFFALGYRPAPLSATTEVELRTAGHLVSRRTVNSDGVRFPYLSAHTQRLSFVEATEPGTVRAVVTVNFADGGTHCVSYMPPVITVRLSFTPN